MLAASRGRGVGAALLRRSFAMFAGRGIRRVVLAVDAENATGATALYERVGMRVVSRFDWWERRWAFPAANSRGEPAPGSPRPWPDTPVAVSTSIYGER